MLLRLFLPLLVCLSIFSACSTKKAEKPKGRPPALVVTGIAGQQDVPQQIAAIGTMEASESVTVRSQISGEIVKVAFREGAEVKKGALLFQLDPRPYQAALKKAEASRNRNRVIMENAQKDYDRYAKLVKEGIVTQEQAEGYRTKAESAAADEAADQAAVEAARVQLSYCNIVSPIAGKLGILAVDRGNVVKANETAMVTINAIAPINALFSVPEKLLPELKQRMASGRLTVAAEVAGNSVAHEQGVVSFIDNTVDSTTGMVKLKALFANPKKLLWPGQFVNLTVTLSEKKGATVVPSQALQTGQKGQFVFVVQGDTAEMRPVVAGVAHKAVTVVESGLKPGEQVVIDGQMRVVPGGKVEIKQPGKANEQVKVPATKDDSQGKQKP